MKHLRKCENNIASIFAMRPGKEGYYLAMFQLGVNSQHVIGQDLGLTDEVGQFKPNGGRVALSRCLLPPLSFGLGGSSTL